MTNEAFRIGVVLSPRRWSGRLHAFIADHVDDVEVVVVRDQRAALEANAAVLVIDDSTPWLNPRFVEEADRAGTRLVGVYDRANDAGRTRLAGLGLTHLIEEGMPPDDVLFLLDRLRPADDSTGPRPPDDDADDADDRVDETSGELICVGGPSGSGAREIAVGLASEFAGRGWATLLVDANETTPGVARRLGLSIYPHLLTAVDRARGHDPAALDAALADRVNGLPFDVITGLPTPRDWDRLVANDLEMMLATCRQRWDRIVVTTSPLIEDLRRWGDRFGISRRVLSICDVAVGCVEPTPRGVLRYLEWVADLSGLGGSAPATVLNKVPRTRRVAAEATCQLCDVGGALVEDVLEVPFDRAVGVAEWDGCVVKRGPFTKAIGALVTELDERSVSMVGASR